MSILLCFLAGHIVREGPNRGGSGVDVVAHPLSPPPGLDLGK